MGVVNFFQDGCGGGCGQAKKASTGCGQPLDGCGTTPSHTHIVPPWVSIAQSIKLNDYICTDVYIIHISTVSVYSSIIVEF